MSLTVIGLILDILGCIMVFTDSFRIAKRTSGTGMQFGSSSMLEKPFFKYFSQIGLILLIIGFVLQVIDAL